MTQRLLSDIRVIDLTRILAGPLACQTLADYGAEVIKIERPGLGDDTRTMGGPSLKARDGSPTNESVTYLAFNRNKKSVTLDISQPEGQSLLRRLAEQADVLVENYKFGTLARYGLDYQPLRQVNPRLVYCSITGFGQTGPYRQRAGYDPIFQALGGMMSVNGERDNSSPCLRRCSPRTMALTGRRHLKTRASAAGQSTTSLRCWTTGTFGTAGCASMCRIRWPAACR